MSHCPQSYRLKLDPWSASSLLQKSIRRGEAALAQKAAAAVRRYRGDGVWRRLITIAVEDIGIADPELVWQVTRLGTDKLLRSVLGSDDDLLDDMVSRLAAAPKDRSADYLYCAATKLPAALLERAGLERASQETLISLASDPSEPPIRRATSALLACSSGKPDAKLNKGRVERLLSAFPVRFQSINNAVVQLAATGVHPFYLMLPLLWSWWWHCGAECNVVSDDLPEAEFVDGIPLYTFDMHTAVGKRAIAMLTQRNAEVRQVLARWVREDRRTNVALMSCFYADAAPVANRLEWCASRWLEFVGMHADMMFAGCSSEAVDSVTQCVRTKLPILNALRRSILVGTRVRGR
jgi:hypothetical protein